uniref:Pentacotripeptide-repeat region of PRORP domain-containing protein n=2 Tax=Brassica oleracea TaxID=3712 RepID=A0A0D3DXM5_BRAOL|nr:unnamed protein product [Brassica oleracea]
MMLRTQRWNLLTTLRLVHLRSTETGTLRNDFFQSPYDFFCLQGFSGLSSYRNLSYKEKLRSGLFSIKKDDAVALFQSMILSRPFPTVIDFNRLFSGIARTKQYDLVLALCNQMELNGISHDLYTLSIVINCFCRCRKLGFAFSAMGKNFKLGYEPNTVTFNTLLNGLCLEGRVFEAVELVDCMVLSQHVPDLITLNTLVNGLCLQDGLSEAMSLIDRMVDSVYPLSP